MAYAINPGVTHEERRQIELLREIVQGEKRFVPNRFEGTWFTEPLKVLNAIRLCLSRGKTPNWKQVERALSEMGLYHLVPEELLAYLKERKAVNLSRPSGTHVEQVATWVQRSKNALFTVTEVALALGMGYKQAGPALSHVYRQDPHLHRKKLDNGRPGVTFEYWYDPDQERLEEREAEGGLRIEEFIGLRRPTFFSWVRVNSSRIEREASQEILHKLRWKWGRLYPTRKLPACLLGPELPGRSELVEFLPPEAVVELPPVPRFELVEEHAGALRKAADALARIPRRIMGGAR